MTIKQNTPWLRLWGFLLFGQEHLPSISGDEAFEHGPSDSSMSRDAKGRRSLGLPTAAVDPVSYLQHQTRRCFFMPP